MYCGALGHPYTVTYFDEDGFERIHGECNALETARKWMAEKPGHIYQKVRKGGAHWKRRWKRVD
jgi:hypothetical protein